MHSAIGGFRYKEVSLYYSMAIVTHWFELGVKSAAIGIEYSMSLACIKVIKRITFKIINSEYTWKRPELSKLKIN